MRNVQAISNSGPIRFNRSPVVWSDYVEAIKKMDVSREISRAELKSVLDELIKCEPDDFREFAEALLDKVFDVGA